MKELIGKRILEILVSEQILVFETLDGPIAFAVYGDCCSWSYFAEVLGVDKIFGEKITKVDIIDDEMPPYTPKPHEDVVSVYGFRLSSEKGNCIIAFRNDSNGYYGGYCDSVKVSAGYREGKISIREDWRSD